MSPKGAFIIWAVPSTISPSHDTPGSPLAFFCPFEVSISGMSESENRPFQEKVQPPNSARIVAIPETCPETLKEEPKNLKFFGFKKISATRAATGQKKGLGSGDPSP
jgi:hypothetical protein